MSRPNLRGQGYMPKGGVKAAQAHNERVRAVAEPVALAPAQRPDVTDVRASARSVRPTVARSEAVWLGLASAPGVVALAAVVVQAVR